MQSANLHCLKTFLLRMYIAYFVFKLFGNIVDKDCGDIVTTVNELPDFDRDEFAIDFS